MKSTHPMVTALATTHVPLALMLQGSLMVDSTGFRTGGNENAASILGCCQAAQKGRQCGRSERRGEAYASVR